MIPSGTVLRCYCWYDASGVGKTGLSPTPTLTLLGPTGSTLVNAQSSTEEGLGFYYYAYTTVADIYGGVHGVFITADATVTQKQLPALIDAYYALTAAKVGYLDAAVTSRSSHSAADVWAVATRTLTSYGTLVADVAAAVWAVATSTWTGAGTAGKYILDQLGLITAARVTIVSPVIGKNITIYRGADHNAADGSAFDLTTTKTLTGGAITVVLKGAGTAGADLTYTSASGTSVLSANVARFQLTAAQSTAIATTAKRYRCLWKHTPSATTRLVVIADGYADVLDL